jgi:hypothetical protein
MTSICHLIDRSISLLYGRERAVDTREIVDSLLGVVFHSDVIIMTSDAFYTLTQNTMHFFTRIKATKW